jgi:effector-binding domain-containing protein
MAEEPSVIDAETRRILAIRRKIRWNQIGEVAMPSLDKVWAHIRGEGITDFGHNLFIYRGMSPLGAEVSFGVEVPAPVGAPKGFVIDETPAGRTATLHQYGEYDKLVETNMTLRRWCDEQKLRLGNISWELYGDWDEDPAKVRTDVFYQLKA